MGERDALIGFFAIVLVLVFATIIRLCMRVPPERPYRKALHRKIRTNGDEEIDLECGHRIALLRHRRESYPCEECAESVAAEDSDG